MPTGQALVARKTDAATGRSSVTGLPELQDSQAYPKEFGIAVARVYKAHVRQLKQEASESERRTASLRPRYPMRDVSDCLQDFGSDMWADADLAAVFQLCRELARL